MFVDHVKDLRGFEAAPVKKKNKKKGRPEIEGLVDRSARNEVSTIGLRETYRAN